MALMNFASARLRRDALIRREREKYLADPSKAQNLIAGALATQVPSSIKINRSGYPTRLAAVEAALPKEDPRAGMGTVIYNRYNQLMQDPEYKQYRPQEIIAALWQNEMEKRKEDIYKYTASQETGLFPSFNNPVVPIPGQQAWEEKNRPIKHMSAVKDITWGLGAEGVWNAGKYLLEKGLSKEAIRRGIGLALKGASELTEVRPLLGLAATAGLSVLDMYTFEEAEQRVARTKYAQKHPVQGTVAALALGMAAGKYSGDIAKILGEKTITKFMAANTMTEAAAEEATAKPTMHALMLYNDAKQDANSAAQDVSKALHRQRTKLIDTLTGIFEKERGERPLSPLYKPSPNVEPNAIPMPGDVTIPMPEHVGKPNLPRLLSEENVPTVKETNLPVVQKYKIKDIVHVDKVIDLVAQGKTGAEAVNTVGEMEAGMKNLPMVRVTHDLVVPQRTAETLREGKVASKIRDNIADEVVKTPEKSKIDLSAKPTFSNVNYGVHLDEEASKYFASFGSGEIPESNGEWKGLSKTDFAKRALIGFGAVALADQFIPTKKAHAMYLGELAEMAPKALLKGAEYAEKLGLDVGRKGVTRNKLGWFKGLDNKWRFEISDEGMKIAPDLKRNKFYFLGDTISHNTLFRNYPQLRNVKVLFSAVMHEGNAVSYFNDNMIEVGTKGGKVDSLETRKSLVHEIQHFVQDIEGFAQGGPSTEVPPDVSAGVSEYLAKTDKQYAKQREKLFELKRKPLSELSPSEKNLMTSLSHNLADKKLKFLDKRYGYKDNLYRHYAGEIEARDVENRINLTPAQRKFYNPYSSELNNPSPYSRINKDNIIFRFAKTPASIGKVAGTIASAVALIPIISLVSPRNANAAGLSEMGAVSDVAEEIISKAKPGKIVSLLKDMKEAGYIVEPQEDPHILPKPMRAIKLVPKLSDIQNKILKIGKAGNFALSPSIQFMNEMGVRNGQELMNNAATEWANHQTAAIVNTSIGQNTFLRIMKDYIPGYQSVAKPLISKMDPVVKKYFPLMQERAFHYGEMKNYEGLMKKEWKKVSRKARYSKDVEDKVLSTLQTFEDQYNIHKAAYESSHTMVAEYHKAWENVVKPLVKQKEYSGLRVFLAAEDTPTFDYYPFLKDTLSFEEQAAVGKVKGMMEYYTGRVINAGEKPILSRPFMHHAWHPSMETNKILEDLKKRFPGDASSIPMLKLHSRAVGFLPMVPDAEYSVTSYLSDINTRLEAMDFWRKGKPDGWWAFKQAIANNPALASEDLLGAFKSFEDGFKPYERTPLNKFADRVYAFEVARLLGFSLSVPFKHSLKILASLRTFGMEGVKAIPKAAVSAIKVAIKQRGGEQWLKDQGLGLDLMDQAVEAYTETGKLYRLVSDISPFRVNQSMADKVLDRVNSIGGTPVAITERFDRALSVVSAMRMAAKKGMTTDQAVYGIFDTILKNNFLAGPLNPAWLRNPKIRLMLTFQGTPWKIMEQRASIWGQAGSDLVDTLKMLKKDVIEGEQEFKWAMIKQGLTKSKDIFGTSLMSQTIREMLLIGTGVETGKVLWDVNLAHHFFHIPIVEVQRKNVAIGSSPILSAALQTMADKQDNEFIVSRFFRHWFQTRKGGIPAPIPLAFKKAVRLSRNDIPKIYQNRKLLYLFGIPAEKSQ